MSQIRLVLWIIAGLSLGEFLRQELKKERYFKQQHSPDELPGSDELPEVDFRDEIMKGIPDKFDSREIWPNCLSIREISDEGSCDSSWAVSAVDTMTDRICIHSKGEHTYRLSATNLINCCVKCIENSGMNGAKILGGCGGGNRIEAWKYWIKNGIVTGGPYGSNESCQPYEFMPCKHFTFKYEKSLGANTTSGNKSSEMCEAINHTPNCKHSCQPLYGKHYNIDKHYGKRAYRIKPDELAIKTEIFHNGPVQASMQLFDDFKDHKSGVYYHRNGNYSNMHAVRIIGWGFDIEFDLPYWLAANSYGIDWGDKGFFKIARGINECLIESNVTAGLPDFQPLLKTQRLL